MTAVKPTMTQIKFPPKICLDTETAYKTEAPPGPIILTAEERTWEYPACQRCFLANVEFGLEESQLAI